MNVVAIGVVLATSLVVAAQAGWQPKPEVVERHTEQRPEFNYDEAAIKPFALPDALATATGHVRTSREWTRRRAEILELFRTHVWTAIYIGYTDGYANLAFDPARAGTLRRTNAIDLSTGRQFFIKTSYVFRF